MPSDIVVRPFRVVAAVAAAASACTGCIGPLGENIERQFADAKSVRAGNRGGWIPDILPDDATGIREVHNLDTNATWGCFRTQKSARCA